MRPQPALAEGRAMRRKNHRRQIRAVHLESIYRMDRDERLQRIFELLAPEIVRRRNAPQGGIPNEQNDRALCESIQR